MRTTKPTIKRYKWGGSSSQWQVDGLRDENGRRVRRFFASRDAAAEWLRLRRPELVSQGRGAVAMSELERIDAKKALAILAPYGASLEKAAQQYAERAQLLERTVLVSQLRVEMLAARKSDGVSLKYIQDLTHRLKRACASIDDRPAATVDVRELDDWMRAQAVGPTTRNNYRKVLHALFAFAVTRGYVKENPVTMTARAKKKAFMPGILLPREIEALLSVAQPEILPWLAISAFAGLRDAEIDRLSWDRIDFASGYIKIDAAVAKTASRRLVPIADNLRSWLAPYAKFNGPIRGNRDWSMKRVREARAEAAKKLNEAGVPAANLEIWPHNALRHSFASYRLALIGNAAQTAEECGHSVTVLKQHYRELVTKEQAEAWFAVKPEAPANVEAFGKVATG